jgi:putative transposase
MKDRFKCDFPAWVILPDHIHWLIKPNDADYSKVVLAFKRAINLEFKKNEIVANNKIWQDRFWEHTVKNDEDYGRCVDYIHFNPVKHGYVENPHEWRYSSFHDYVAQGFYENDWVGGKDIDVSGSEYD